MIIQQTQIDWPQVRNNFPAATTQVYFNTAAAGPVSNRVAETAVQFYKQMNREGDNKWTEWLTRREQIRANLAAFINAEPDEIAFTINTSTGMNTIIDALEGEGEVISCELEFPVSTIPWMHRGIKVHRIKPIDGVVSTEHVHESMTTATKIIVLSHVEYSNGLRIDVEEIGRNKKEHLFVVGASQSAGVLPIDVKRMQIDALCSTGHKWMLAGYGTGFVYISRRLMKKRPPRAIGWMSVEDPFAVRNDSYVIGPSASSRAELGCPHFAGIFALGAAIETITELGIENIESRALRLNRYLTSSLGENGWKILSPLATEKTRSAETLVRADDPERLVHFLRQRGIMVTEKPEGMRIATHFFNNESDIDSLTEALKEYRS